MFGFGTQELLIMLVLVTIVFGTVKGIRNVKIGMNQDNAEMATLCCSRCHFCDPPFGRPSETNFLPFSPSA